MEKNPSANAETYALLASLIESPKDFIIFALDRNYRYTAFNSSHRKTMLRLWGVEIEIGMNMLEVINDPHDRKKAKTNFDRAMRGESFTYVEEYGESPNRFHYENCYNPISDEQGAVIGVSVFLTDVTDKIKANQELELYKTRLEEIVTERTAQLEQLNKKLERELTRRRQAEKEARKFKKIIQTTAQSVIITQIDGTVLYVNPSYYEWSGYSEQEVIGKPMFQFASPDGARILQTEIIPALFAGGQWHGEMTVVKKTGESAPAELYCSLLKDDQGQPEYFVAVFTDISERKRSIEEINKLSRVVETTSQAIVISKLDGTIVYVNQGLLNLLKNLNSADILGKSIFEFTDDEGVEKLKTEIIPALISTGHWRGAARLKINGQTALFSRLTKFAPSLPMKMASRNTW
ncbi:MAG: PAS domain S-box protein [FCB group bacterium]|nr:PAS domain S-box protein [FCB group bacterium]